MAEIHKLQLVEIGEGVRLDEDEVIRAALGQRLRSVVIIGETPEGDMWISSNANGGEAIIQMERAKRFIIFGDLE